MWKVFGKINHFTLSGLGWGVLLGGLSGTLILPIIGTLMAAFEGAGMRIALGLIIGSPVVISDVLFGKNASDRHSYRRKLSAVTGGVTVAGAVSILIATTNGILWGPGSFGAPYFFIPSLLAGGFWGALAAAYTVSHYVDD